MDWGGQQRLTIMRKSFLLRGTVAFAAMWMGANVMAQSITEQKTMEDEVYLYCLDASFVYNQQCYMVHISDESVILYNDEFEVVKSFDADILGGLMVYSLRFGKGSTDSREIASVTQTLFNNDEKYEYICSSGVVGHDMYDLHKGFKVLTEDGECIYEFQGVIADSYDVMVIQINEKNYLSVVEHLDQYKYTTHFLRIDKEANSVQEVCKVNGRMNIRPTVVDRDAQITITLDDDNKGVDRELVITGANGQLVDRRTIPAGENTVKVSASMMRSGMYNFTLQKKGEIVDNGKVIVK